MALQSRYIQAKVFT